MFISFEYTRMEHYKSFIVESIIVKVAELIKDDCSRKLDSMTME